MVLRKLNAIFVLVLLLAHVQGTLSMVPAHKSDVSSLAKNGADEGTGCEAGTEQPSSPKSNSSDDSNNSDTPLLITVKGSTSAQERSSAGLLVAKKAKTLAEKLKCGGTRAQFIATEKDPKNVFAPVVFSLQPDEPATDPDDLEPIADKLSIAALGLHASKSGKEPSPEERVSQWRNSQADTETQKDLEIGPAGEKLPTPEVRRRCQHALQRWFNSRSKLGRGALSFGGMCGLTATATYFGHYQNGYDLAMETTGYELGEAGAAFTQQCKLKNKVGASAVWMGSEAAITFTLVPSLQDFGLTEVLTDFYVIHTVLYAKKNNLRNATDLTDVLCFLPREAQKSGLFAGGGHAT